MKYYEEVLSPNKARLTCYIQDKSDEMPQNNIRPAVLIFPGGAYRICSDREAEPVALAYAHYGYNAFVLRYTVTGHNQDATAPEAVFDKAFADAEAAIQYLYDNADKLNIDKKRIVVVGFSAGGNLAAALGTMGRLRPAALVLGYASVDNALNRRLNIIQPTILEQVDEKTPPAFLFATQGDSIVEATNTLKLSIELAARRIPYETHVFASGDHGLSLALATTGQANVDVAGWFAMSVRFLDRIWSENSPEHTANADISLNANNPVNALLESVKGRKILQKYIPQLLPMLEAHPEIGTVSLRRLAQLSGGKIDEKTVEAIDVALQEK